MKKILIEVYVSEDKIGTAIHKTQGIPKGLEGTLFLVGVFENLKSVELKKLDMKFNKTFKKDEEGFKEDGI